MGRQRQQRRGNQRGASRQRRKVRRNVTTGIVHIKSSFNNTIVSVSDQEGNVIAWESAGIFGLQGEPQEHAVRGPDDRRSPARTRRWTRA